jgi:hypothetical protein
MNALSVPFVFGQDSGTRAEQRAGGKALRSKVSLYATLVAAKSGRVPVEKGI